MRAAIIFVFSLLSLSLSAQPSPEYSRLTNLADSLFAQKQYRSSARTYLQAFAANKDMAQVKHRYFAACAWAEAGEADSAFIQLDRIAVKGRHFNYPQISKDLHFQKLYADKRWEPLLAIIQENMKKEQEHMNQNVPKKD